MKNKLSLQIKLLFTIAVTSIFVSCSNNTSQTNDSNSQSIANGDTTSFNYFLSLFEKENYVPQYLWEKYFPATLKNSLLEKQKNHRSVDVVGKQLVKYKGIKLVQFNTIDGSPCEVSNIITYNSTNSFVSSRSFTLCDCNESFCEGESIKGIADSLITIERRVWSGYDEDEDAKAPIDTSFINYLYINKNGYLKELDRKKELSSDFIIFDNILGDLDKDGIIDSVFITKGTDMQNVIKDEYRGVLDRNRRGVIIKLSGDDFKSNIIKNLNCFSSENEDGGVYFPPELLYEIKNNVLFLKYNHGRYGNWQYLFRYQNNDFELIGYDVNENRGPIVNRSTSINYTTNKVLVKTNTTPDSMEKPVFEEKWGKVKVDELLKLSEIEDFGDLYLSGSDNFIFENDDSISLEGIKKLIESKKLTNIDYYKNIFELGNYEETYSGMLSYDNIYEAIKVLKHLKMLEIDDYFEEETPLSSSRNIEFNLSAINSDNFSNLKINGKELELELDENSNEKTKIYKARTSTLKSYEYEGMQENYVDMIYFEITYEGNEIVEFKVKSNLNGFLSDDEFMTLNPRNNMSLEELRKIDNGTENSISAICNGYESMVTLKKTDNNKLILNFSVKTVACAF